MRSSSSSFRDDQRVPEPLICFGEQRARVFESPLTDLKDSLSQTQLSNPYTQQDVIWDEED